MQLKQGMSAFVIVDAKQQVCIRESLREVGSYLVSGVDQTLHGTKQRAVCAYRDDDLIHGINVM